MQASAETSHEDAAAACLKQTPVQWFFHGETQWFPRNGDTKAYLNWRAMEYELAATMWFVCRLTCAGMIADPSRNVIMSLLPPAPSEDALRGATVVEIGQNDDFVGADLRAIPARDANGQPKLELKVSSCSVLQQGIAPRVLLLHFDAHVAVAVHCSDNKVAVFDSRGLSSKSDVFRCYANAVMHYYRSKSVRKSDIYSVNESVDLQGAGDWYCQTWVYYFVYRLLVLEEEPSRIMRSLSLCACSAGPTALCQEVLRFKRFLASVSDSLTLQALHEPQQLVVLMTSFVVLQDCCSSSVSANNNLLHVCAMSRHPRKYGTLVRSGRKPCQLNVCDVRIFHEHFSRARKAMQTYRYRSQQMRTQNCIL
jgi:hypothetical protein